MTRTGKLVTFFAHTKSGRPQITGEEIDFGLVLHPVIGPDDVPSPENGWTISEPITGRSICHGKSSIDCAGNFRLTILHHGGLSSFARDLELSIQKFIAAARETTPCKP